jgi:hypothetical protein
MLVLMVLIWLAEFENNGKFFWAKYRFKKQYREMNLMQIIFFYIIIMYIKLIF